jgi:hypothetical protein
MTGPFFDSANQTQWSLVPHPLLHPPLQPHVGYQGLWLVPQVPVCIWQESALRELMSHHSLLDTLNLLAQEEHQDLLERERSLLSPQSSPATTVVSVATRPSVVTIPTSTAAPSAMSPTPITITTHAPDAAPPPYMTKRLSVLPISLNRCYGNLLQVQEGLQWAEEILNQELRSMVLELAEERERDTPVETGNSGELTHLSATMGEIWT